VAFTLAGTTADEPPLHVMLNMGKDPLEFAVPEIAGWTWRLVIDTDQEPSIMKDLKRRRPADERVRLAPRSIMVLEGLAA
jgi:glycogen operon protein